MNTGLSLGGVAVGLAILVRQFLPWWWKSRSKGGEGGGDSRDWKHHVPFAYGLVFGGLTAACVGGAFGAVGGWIKGASNWAGDSALAYGPGTASPDVTSKALPGLSPGGGVVALLAFVGVIVLWKTFVKKLRGELLTGVWCGATLTGSAGLVGILGTVLVPVVNALGNPITGALT